MDDHRVFSSIRPIEDAWHQLAEETAASLFLWPGWVAAWVDAYGDDHLRIHTVWRDGRLVGVMPVLTDPASTASTANWNTPRSGPIALDEQAARSLAQIATADRPPRIELSHLHEDDPATGWYVSGLDSYGYLPLPTRDLMRSPYTRLVDSWEEFELRFGKSRRKWLRRMDRRLAEAGELTVEVHEGGARLDELLVEGFAVEGSGWKGREGTSINADPVLRSLLISVATWAADRGMLRLLFLRLDGRPLSFDLMLAHQGVIYALKGGYDEEFRSFGPSVVAMREIVKYGIGNGMHTIEWLGNADTDDYKIEWSDGTREVFTQSWLAPTVKGRTEHLARHTWRWTRRRLRDVRSSDAARRISEGTASLRQRLPGRGP